jgi:hypothetical protein
VGVNTGSYEMIEDDVAAWSYGTKTGTMYVKGTITTPGGHNSKQPCSHLVGCAWCTARVASEAVEGVNADVARVILCGR